MMHDKPSAHEGHGMWHANRLSHVSSYSSMRRPTFEVTAVGNNGDCAGAGPAAASS